MSVSPIATTTSSSSSLASSIGPWNSVTLSGSVLPCAHWRSVSGVPSYRPSSVSGGSMLDLVRVAPATARLRRRSRCSASRRETSAEWSRALRRRAARNSSRVTCGALRRWRAARGAPWRPSARKYAQSVAHVAAIAERFRAADAAAVQNQRVGRARPALRRQQRVRAPPRRPRDRRMCTRPMRLATRSTCRSTGRPGHAERVSRARRWPSCVRRPAASTSASIVAGTSPPWSLDERAAPCRRRLRDFIRKNPVELNLRLELFRRRRCASVAASG